MQVTTKIAVDLTRANIGARVSAVQGDGNTRSVEITLLSDGRPWTPPEGVDVAIAYCQPGGHKGLYNLLADGTQAITISGNVATIILAPQMLTESGTVQASLVFNDAQLNRLTTFPFSVSVASNPAAGAQKTEDYLRLQWLEDKLDEYLAEIKASGAFDGRPGRDGIDGKDGAPGRDGADGKDGAPGADGHTPEYGVDYGTPEQIAGIAQQAAEILQPDLSQIKGDLSAEQTAREAADNALRADLTANTNADAVTRRSLDALWKLNHGISYQFETDDAAAYSKTVPSGAKLASVEQIGGNTVIWNHLLRNGNFNGVNYWRARSSTLSANNNEIVCNTGGYYGGFTAEPTNASVYAGHKYLAAIDVLATSGLNVYWPYFDDDIIENLARNRCTGEYQHCVGIYSAKATGASLFGVRTTVNGEIQATIKAKNAIFIDLTKMFGPGREPTSTDDPRIAWIDQYAISHPEYNAGELVSADVESVKHNNVVMADIPANVRNLPGYGWSAGDVCNSTERTETGWQYVQRVGSRDYQDGDTVTDGVTSYYALETPVTTDITDMMADFPVHFEVEAGGTITLENAAKLPIPSTEKYIVSLAEVNQ